MKSEYILALNERCEYKKLIIDWHRSEDSELTKIQDRIDYLDKKYPFLAYEVK